MGYCNWYDMNARSKVVSRRAYVAPAETVSEDSVDDGTPIKSFLGEYWPKLLLCVVCFFVSLFVLTFSVNIFIRPGIGSRAVGGSMLLMLLAGSGLLVSTLLPLYWHMDHRKVLSFGLPKQGALDQHDSNPLSL